MPRLFHDDLPPLMNAAGTVKTVDHVLQLVGAPVPAVMVGSFTVEERSGNPGRTFLETPSGALNSMGLPSPALDTWRRWIPRMSEHLADAGQQLWVSVAGFAADEFRVMTDAALEGGAHAVELNLGCPNVWDGGRQKQIVSYSAEQTASVLEAVGDLALEIPVGVKLSPILDSMLLTEVDQVLAGAQVAFLTTMNTVPNCFAHDDAGRSAISFGQGLAGMSGPATKWIGLGQVKAHRELLPKTPIVGVGGITNGCDLAEYLDPLVGADACQIGTAFWKRGPRVLTEILQEYAEQPGIPAVAVA